MLIGAAGGSTDVARLQMHNMIERLTTVAGWLDVEGKVFDNPKVVAITNDEATTKGEDETADMVNRLAKVIIDEILPGGKKKPAEIPT